MFEVHRTPEQGHSTRCLAHAIVIAVENARDRDAEVEHGDLYFRLSAQENAFLYEADIYLAEGSVECLCPRIPVNEDAA